MFHVIALDMELQAAMVEEQQLPDCSLFLNSSSPHCFHYSSCIVCSTDVNVNILGVNLSRMYNLVYVLLWEAISK